jgi:hypothetical protein
MLPDSALGLIKAKGINQYCLSPDRFNQLGTKVMTHYLLLKKNMIGYCAWQGIYWVIIIDDNGEFLKVPFAKNEAWFKALTSELEMLPIAELTRIYITGIS